MMWQPDLNKPSAVVCGLGVSWRGVFRWVRLFVLLDYYTNMYCTSECKQGRLNSLSDFK